MTPPIRPEVDPLEALKALKAQQPDATDPLAQLKALRPQKHDYHAEYKSGALKQRMDAANARDAQNLAETPPDYATQALGGIAALARDIPGAEALQAGARALVRGQSYRDALNDIRGAEDAAPSAVRRLNRFAGGAVASSAVPGGAVIGGARYGILTGLLQADPDADIHQRIRAAATGGIVGAGAGKLANVGTTALRGVFAKSSGEVSRALTSGMKAADEAAYGRAAQEGAMPQPMPPEVHAAFNAPDIKPFVDVVRDSRKFAGADEPTILREAYKLMSERQGVLGTRVLNAADHKAGTTLENADIGLAKQQLLSAADQVMPSFRPAVEQHARLAGNRAAFQTMSDAAKRLIRNTSIPAKKLDKQSEEAVLEAVQKMKEEAAGAGLDGALGRLKDSYHFSPNPLKLFGAGPAIGAASRVTPLVNALDRQVGTGTSAAAEAIRSALIGASPSRVIEILKAAGLQ